MLVSASIRHEGELRADLQRFYGIDYDRMMEHSARHISALVANMPPGESRLYAAIDPDNGWTAEQVLLARLVNDFDRFMWGMADKKSRGPEPKPIGPSWMREPMRKLEARTMSIDELMEELAKPRR